MSYERYLKNEQTRQAVWAYYKRIAERDARMEANASDSFESYFELLQEQYPFPEFVEFKEHTEEHRTEVML